MAVGDISEDKIKEATGKSWSEWQRLFADIDARDLSHKEIVHRLAEETDVDGWWLQTVTVRYEQEIGRRKKGQEKDGTYTLGVGKVVNGSIDDVFAKWLDEVEAQTEHNGQKNVAEPRVTTSEKWRYWRAEYADGTKAVMSVHQMKPGKVGFAIDQQKCQSEAQAKTWKAFWRAYVDEAFTDNTE